MVELKVYKKWEERKIKYAEDEESEALHKPEYEETISDKAGIRIETVNTDNLNSVLNDADGYSDESGFASVGPILVTTKNDDIIYDINEKGADQEAERRFEMLKEQG